MSCTQLWSAADAAARFCLNLDRLAEEGRSANPQRRLQPGVVFYSASQPAMPRQRDTRRVPINRATVLALVDDGALIPGTSQFYDGDSDKYVVSCLQRIVKRVVVRTYSNVPGFLNTLDEVRPDVVFNLTQKAHGDRQKDSHICAVLELLGISYTGAGPKSLALCRDKAISKLIAAREGFVVPRFFVVQSDAVQVTARFPLVVKPRFEDASEGIIQGSLVRTNEALLRRIEALRGSGCADIICEEFLGGREFVVGVAGNRVIRPREFIIGRKGRGAPVLACTKLKYDEAYRRKWQVRTEFARLTSREYARLEELVLRTFNALDIRDYGRLDVKLMESGEWGFIEANPNPGLAPYGRSFAGAWGGIDYTDLIKEITLGALRRTPAA